MIISQTALIEFTNMKQIFFFFFALIASANTFAQTNPNYDEKLAKELNADDYGMKPYYFIILKSGNNTDTLHRNESFVQHLKNINRLVKEQKLVVAGPMMKNDKNYRGIFIFQNIKTEDELKAILDSDLAIKNKFLDYEFYNWYGSAALPTYLENSDKIWKKNP